MTASSDSVPSLELLVKEKDYYKRQFEELCGKVFNQDYQISESNHEIMQLRKGFALMAELQKNIGAVPDISVILDEVADTIAAGMQMDRTLILEPIEKTPRVRVSRWLGFPRDEAELLGHREIELPREFWDSKSSLLVNSKTPETPLVALLRRELGVPYLICTRVVASDHVIAVLLAGRSKEVKPLSLSLQASDVQTFEAIAGLMAAMIENIKIGVLEELDRAKTQFFSNVSHELRTPLTLILGPLDGALAGQFGDLPPALRNNLESMLRNARNLLNLINQLLDFSRLESRKMQLRIQRVRLGELLANILSAFRPFADRRKIQLTSDIAADLPDLDCDPARVEQIFYNLLSNACKFTRPQGHITLSATVEHSGIVIAVADTGIGIREDQLPYVFDRFHQADGSASCEYEGTGIGLWLAKQLVELHGGSISVQSTYGSGTTFTVRLPLARYLVVEEKEKLDEESAWTDSRAQVALAGLAVPDQEIEPSTTPQHDHTLLIVEDHADMRRFLVEICRPQYDTLAARDGLEGLEQTRAHKPHLIVSDVMMPRMDGYQFCRKIKSDPALSHIPVILLTAKADVAMKVEGLESGADDYLTKPFNARELLARIRNLIRLREQEAQLKAFNEELERKVQEQVAILEKAKFLTRFLSPQLVTAVMKGEKTIPAGHERRKLTVLFSDIKDFTQSAEEMEPEEIHRLLNHYLSEMTAIAYKYGGSMDEFMGDGLMVFFGAPDFTNDRDHALRCVRMSIEMQEKLQVLNKFWLDQGLEHPFSMRIGINTGYAAVGTFGSEYRLKYGVIGRQVNLASRLEGICAPGAITLSHSTYVLVKEEIECVDKGEVTVKGVVRPLRIYEVIRPRSP